MKKQVIALLGLIGCLYLTQYTSELSAGGRECREITYRQILNEMDHYIHELDRFDREEAWFNFQAVHNARPPDQQRLKALYRQRQHCERNLMRIQEQLDRAHVDIGHSLMGSSTGFCEEQSNLYRIYQDIPRSGTTNSGVSVSSTLYRGNEDREKNRMGASHNKNKDKRDDKGSDYSGFESDLYGGSYWRHQQNRLSYTRRLLNQKDQLTMQQVGIAAKLGSVTVPALKQPVVISGGRRHGLRRSSASRQHGSATLPKRRVIRNGILIK